MQIVGDSDRGDQVKDVAGVIVEEDVVAVALESTLRGRDVVGFYPDRKKQGAENAEGLDWENHWASG